MLFLLFSFVSGELLERGPLKVYGGYPMEPMWPVIFAVQRANITTTERDPDTYSWRFTLPNGQVSTSCTLRGVTNQDPCNAKVVEFSWEQAGEYKAELTHRSQSGATETIEMKATIQPHDGPQVIRQEFRDIPKADYEAYVKSLVQLKELGIYDHLSSVHASTFDIHETAPGRTAAHGGPSFLPWHRVFLRVKERNLQILMNDDTFGLPYWDWGSDSANPALSPLFTSNYAGGDGDDAQNDVLTNGPFCNSQTGTCARLWRVPSGFDIGPAIRRAFGEAFPPGVSFPSRQEIDLIKALTDYDVAPYHTQGFQGNGFRPALEGWIRGPFGLAHNGIHLWVGGTMVSSRYSVQDPIFFLHHNNVDRIYSEWQAEKRCYDRCYKPYRQELTVTANTPGAQMHQDGYHYLPGQNWDEVMYPWKVRIKDVADDPSLPTSAIRHYKFANLGEKVEKPQKKAKDAGEPTTISFGSGADKFELGVYGLVILFLQINFL